MTKEGIFSGRALRTSLSTGAMICGRDKRKKLLYSDHKTSKSRLQRHASSSSHDSRLQLSIDFPSHPSSQSLLPFRPRGPLLGARTERRSRRLFLELLDVPLLLFSAQTQVGERGSRAGGEKISGWI